MNQISSCQHCIFIECIHEIISWCQCHDSLNGKHLFYRQWCWNHIWFVRSCSQFRMVPIIAYPEFIETTCKNHVQWFAVIDFIMFNEQYEHDSRECQKAKQRASRLEKQCRAWMHWRIPGVWEIRYARAGVRNVGWDDANSMPAMRYATRR